MRYFINLLLIFSLSEAVAQQLTIDNCKNAAYLSGAKLENGDVLVADRKVKIEKDGHLGLKDGHWAIYLTSGIYDMDSVIMGQRQRREYVVDDSVYSILKTRNLGNCQNRRIQCGNPYKYLNHNYKKDRVTKTSSDSLVLNWESESNYSGLYFIVFSNMWEEYIGIQTSDKNELILDLLPYKKEKFISYKVISEDCFESEIKLIQIE